MAVLCYTLLNNADRKLNVSLMIKSIMVQIYKNRSVRIKLLLNYVATVLFIVVILSVLNAKNLLFEIEGLLDRNTSQLIGQTKNSVEYYIRDLENIVFYLSRDNNLKAYVRTEDKEQRLIFEESLKQSLETYSVSHAQIDGLLIAFDDNTIISNNMVTISRDPITNDLWYKKAIDASTKLHLFAKPIERNVKNIYDYYSSDNLVSIVKAITIDGEDEPVGVMLIDLKIDDIGETMASLEQQESEFFYMIDEGLDVIYAPINQTVYRVDRDQVTQVDGGGFEQTINSKPYKILYEYSSYLNCYFIGVFSLNPLYAIINAIQGDMVVYAFFLLLLGILLTSLLTRTITKPLLKLQQLMKHVEQGDLDIEFEVKSDDEIGQLGHGFNKMIASINDLIKLVASEQQKKREAELKAFQAQIKPHFLYNTLDTINWMAQEYEADDISDIVCNLTTLFRLSLSKGKEIISLEDELEQVESYLKIQMVRYKDKFEYNVICPDELKDYQVVKLILQPLVENAIYHGIKGNKRFGEINITISCDDQYLWCEVSDNGVGIPYKQLNRINHELMFNERIYDEMGIGIININERIKLYHGAEYGLERIQSSEAGTRIRLKMPPIVK